VSTDAHPPLDILADSRDVMLRNDAIEALLRRDTHAATVALHALADFEPQHEALVSLGVLIAALAPATGRVFASHAKANAMRQAMVSSVAPAAQTVLRAEARGWLAPLWRRLAELAWLAPACFTQCARALADPLLDRLVRCCETEFEVDVGHITELLARFPAWLLNDQPALLPRLRQAEPGQGSEAERAFSLMDELLGLERQGRHAELIEGRKRAPASAPADPKCPHRARRPGSETWLSTEPSAFAHVTRSLARAA
jgi:hypothetical protein